jgi:hypothetical protein
VLRCGEEERKVEVGTGKIGIGIGIGCVWEIGLGGGLGFYLLRLW